MVSKVMKNDEGVSAVIGVILMVAITVILAAVIAAFVFSMSNNVGTTYTVAFTAKKTADGSIIVTNNGGADVSKLANVTISVQPAGGSPVPVMMAQPNTTLNTVGSSITIREDSDFTPVAPATPIPGVTYVLHMAYPNHVIVTGTFQDGSQQVLIATDI